MDVNEQTPLGAVGNRMPNHHTSVVCAVHSGDSGDGSDSDDSGDSGDRVTESHRVLGYRMQQISD